MVLIILIWLVTVSNGISSVEKWDQFELQLNGPSSGNPFIDNKLFADFTNTNDEKTFHVRGFYDGNGIYKTRFMPDKIGVWSYVTFSNVKSMNNISDKFNVTKVSGNNYGPIVVDKSNKKSFIYLETGEEFFQTGTTSYAWIHERTYNQTLKTIEYISNNNIFNKIRMTVFPKWYEYTHDEPVYYPYIGISPNSWGNFDKFNIDYWHHLDYCLQTMLSAGNIIADIILFHPYDQGHWGFDCMGCIYPTNYSHCRKDPDIYNTSNDLFYLRYIIARIASYRHVWYSMANEFDHISCKQKGIINQTNGPNPADTFPIWDQYFETLMSEDPYGNDYKEKSIHNGKIIYNYSQPWTTHLSVQGFSDVPYIWWQNLFNISKPVILDEEGYEGNISTGWGSMTSAQETDRFWMGNSNSNFVGHSECVLPNNTNNGDGTSIMWWNLGNKLRGESYKKIEWFGNYMRNKTNHPLFSEMDTFCYHSDWEMNGYLNVTKCKISQLYKPGIFYLIYFSDQLNVQVNVGNNDLYELSYIDYNKTKIEMIKNVSGPKIELTP
eukprot:422046_1